MLIELHNVVNPDIGIANMYFTIWSNLLAILYIYATQRQHCQFTGELTSYLLHVTTW